MSEFHVTPHINVADEIGFAFHTGFHSQKINIHFSTLKR